MKIRKFEVAFIVLMASFIFAGWERTYFDGGDASCVIEDYDGNFVVGIATHFSYFSVIGFAQITIYI